MGTKLTHLSPIQPTSDDPSISSVASKAGGDSSSIFDCRNLYTRDEIMMLGPEQRSDLSESEEIS